MLLRSTLAILFVLGTDAWTSSPLAAPPARIGATPVQPRANVRAADFFESLKYKLTHARTMATVQHVLVDTEAKLDEIKSQVVAGGSNEEAMTAAANEFSTCPSGKKKGGYIGPFGMGQMQPEFEQVSFEGEVDQLHTCKTKFGFHLVRIERRKSV
jgi:peptidyl-prolyl cis-trans isomerase C